MISKLSSYKVSIFKLVSIAKQTGFWQNLLETLKTGPGFHALQPVIHINLCLLGFFDDCLCKLFLTRSFVCLI